MVKWCPKCRRERAPEREECPWCGERLLKHKPLSDEGRLMVYGTDNPVAASHLLALLEEQGIPAQVINRPDVYWGGRGVWFPDVFQVLVPESCAEQDADKIDAAIAEVEGQLGADDDEQDT